MGEPTITLLSLGAGVQSTVLLMLSAEGRLPKLGGAIFSDTGWEPRAVYDHLDRLEREVATPAGIPIYRVSSGNIRDDALDPEHRFATMPLYVLGLNGEPGIVRRQCTSEYKIKPIKAKVRDLLGYPHPRHVPKGVRAEQWIGISTDEAHRANVSDVRFTEHRFPLLDLGWSRRDCITYLERWGWGDTPKSACIGCPFHGNRAWRELRDNSPGEWADAVAFDHAIRGGSARANATGSQLRGQAFLHRSRVPLDQAPIDHRTRPERASDQIDLLDGLAVEVMYEEDDLPGCSPFACRSDALGEGSES